MQNFCRPWKCLSFLAGREPPRQIADHAGGETGKLMRQQDAGGDEDEDDFFGDDWDGPTTSSASSSKAEAPKTQQREAQSVTKRAGAGGNSPSPQGIGAGAGTSPGTRKPSSDTDFFSDMGMEIQYKAPRVRQNKSSLMHDDSALEEVGADGGWGGEDLNLKL
mmetsp:Transcript_49654/g.118247  ORF Transcript_49654/g.118247 Transcript_49654/m.118247 type:complete len:163 (+) Transcript_49654:123-611(+)|eukprot:CAMPEP_0178428104 /NCGR_PEP_ID=MMETSP0689_2-20121128/30097_1 /TAXON_ID=160604 /ORGANISM="Amphidinium massartii, Strain CS-259" /LENGTH=162 /DNA_ID=CAMNT_0020049849 /DNA_START=59 /DNA_END=547 /DNA_ORIENTATION=+